MFEVRPLTDQTWADLKDLFRSVRWSDRTWLLVRLVLAGAVDYARERRVRMIEAHPVDKLERRVT
jgi:hypothetical protein